MLREAVPSNQQSKIVNHQSKGFHHNTQSAWRPTLDEFIAREVDAGRIDASLFTREARAVHLHGHCHQKALASVEPTTRMLSLPENYQVTERPL